MVLPPAGRSSPRPSRLPTNRTISPTPSTSPRRARHRASQGEASRGRRTSAPRCRARAQLSAIEQSDGRRRRGWRPTSARGSGRAAPATTGDRRRRVQPPRRRTARVYYAALGPAYAAARNGSIWSQLTSAHHVRADRRARGAVHLPLALRAPARPARLRRGGRPARGLPADVHLHLGRGEQRHRGQRRGGGDRLPVDRHAAPRGLAGLVGGLGVLLGLLPSSRGRATSSIRSRRSPRSAPCCASATGAPLVGVGLLVPSGLVVQVVWSQTRAELRPHDVHTPGGGRADELGRALDPGLYISYVWQIFLPRLPFMNDHFVQTWPFFNIYVERAWASFGWYTIQFPRYALRPDRDGDGRCDRVGRRGHPPRVGLGSNAALGAARAGAASARGHRRRRERVRDGAAAVDPGRDGPLPVPGHQRPGILAVGATIGAGDGGARSRW